MPVPSAYIFPQTLFDTEWVFPLLQIFSPLMHISVSPRQGARSLWEQNLHEAVSLIPCSPPLTQEAEERFNHLMRLVHSSAEKDHIEQFKMLFLAHLGQPPASEEASALVHRLSREGKVKNNNADNDLWRARALLLLLEKTDKEQSEVLAGLARINERQQTLFTELTADELALLQKNALQEEESFAAMLRRIKAWATLFHNMPLPAPAPIFVTTRQDIMELFLEKYVMLSGETGLPLPTLPLPARPVANEQHMTYLPIKSSCTAALQEGLHLVTSTAADDSVKMERTFLQLTERAHQWRAEMEQTFPAVSHGRKMLKLTLFTRANFSQILNEIIANPPVTAKPSSQTNNPAPTPWVAGLLTTEA